MKRAFLCSQQSGPQNSPFQSPSSDCLHRFGRCASPKRCPPLESDEKGSITRDSSALRLIDQSQPPAGNHSAECLRPSLDLYRCPFKPLFLAFSHRFFIKSDKRFLPSGVGPVRFLFRRLTWPVAATLPASALGGWPSRAAIAWLNRSLSLFNSSTILSVSNMPSCRLVTVCGFRIGFRQPLRRAASIEHFHHQLLTGR
jgi:hypothetical protein